MHFVSLYNRSLEILAQLTWSVTTLIFLFCRVNNYSDYNRKTVMFVKAIS